MRVLLVAVMHLGSLGYYCDKALRELGLSVNTLDYRRVAYGAHYHPTGKWGILWSRILKKGGRAYIAERVSNALLSEAGAMQPDIILVQKGELIPPSAILRLKDICNATTAVWHSDSPFDVETSSIELVQSLQFYDYAFVFDPYYVPAMRQAGAMRSSYLPLACDPGVHRPSDLSASMRRRLGSGVCFVGNYQGAESKRTRLMAALAKYDLRIWGSGWNKAPDARLREKWSGTALYGLDMAQVYSASDIVVNVHHRQSIQGCNMRTFEAPACGAFTLTDRLSCLYDFFSPDEIVDYSDEADACSKVEYYLAHPDARMEIAKRCQRRVVDNHTYRHRMASLLSTFNL